MENIDGFEIFESNLKREHDVIDHESRFPQETSSMSVIWTRVTGEASRHGLFPREPPVVKGMHVNHLLCFDDGEWLGFLFPPSLASQRNPELLHHPSRCRTSAAHRRANQTPAELLYHAQNQSESYIEMYASAES